MSAMSAADVLDAAADYIDEHGWVQGMFGRPGGPCCALAAIDDARHDAGPRYDGTAEAALVSHIGGGIPSWNDKPGQTAANVTATMRKVAADLRAKDGAR